MRNDDYDDLDRLLDSGLAAYSAREPWPGIENRVVAKLAPAPPRYKWLRYAVPIPVLAIVLAFVAHWSRPDVTPAIALPQADHRNVYAGHNTQPRPIAIAKQPGLRRSSLTRKSMARPKVFPTPSSPTLEERILLQFANSRPEVLQDVLISKERQDRPVFIEPVRIRPLITAN
jgi:hypothetical protein